MPHQISIFAENKPGKITRITGILSHHEVNIRAVTISDSDDYGIIKLLVDRPLEGCDFLKEEGVAASLRDIVAVKIGDTPGSLFDVSGLLSESGINVEDAYGFTIREGNQAVFVFQVEDIHGSEKVLTDAGYTVLSDSELYYL
jgi:hypothetical protein